jgi:hypothetical protein
VRSCERSSRGHSGTQMLLLPNYIRIRETSPGCPFTAAYLRSLRHCLPSRKGRTGDPRLDSRWKSVKLKILDALQYPGEEGIMTGKRGLNACHADQVLQAKISLSLTILRCASQNFQSVGQSKHQNTNSRCFTGLACQSCR